MSQVDEYLNGMASLTETYRVLGVKQPLSIENAWFKLKIVAKTLEQNCSEKLRQRYAEYREWDSLVHGECSVECDAQDVTSIAQHVVVLGGAGSGKSTLCQRTVHFLCKEGKVVSWIRLQDVANLIEKTQMQIGEAIIKVATNGFRQDEELYRNIDQPRFLVADGLDECGVKKVAIAEALRRWAVSRPNTVVIISSRTAGYEPSLFPNFTHVEIMPFDKEVIEQYSQSLISALVPQSEVDKNVKQFGEKLTENRLASLAARSPMLLSFMIQLFLDGVELGKRRVNLFEKIIEKCRKTETRYRHPVESVIANKALDAIGWILHTQTFNGGVCSEAYVLEELIELLQKNLNIEKSMAIEYARECLIFWDEKGLVERKSVQGTEVIDFIHLSFREYAVARYMQSFSQRQLSDILRDFSGNPRWREILLFVSALGRSEDLTSILLMIDNPESPISIEALLAVDAIVEADSCPEMGIAVADNLVQRLPSNIPLVSYESAEALVKLADIIPEQICEQVSVLSKHTNRWTRDAALFVTIKCGSKYVDRKDIKAFFERYQTGSIEGEIDDDFTSINNKLLKVAIEVVTDCFEKEEAAEMLVWVFDSGHFSMYISDTLFKKLEEVGQGGKVLEYLKSFSDKFDFQKMWKMRSDPEKALLEAIVEIANDDDEIPANYNKYEALGVLFATIVPMDMGVNELWGLTCCKKDAARTVLSGVIKILGLSLGGLKRDALDAIQEMNSEKDIFLLTLPPRTLPRHSWEKAKDLSLPTADLIEALGYPTLCIARPAAYLLINGAGSTEEPELLERILWSKNFRGIEIVAKIGSTFWKSESLEIMLRRLDGGPIDGTTLPIYESMLGLDCIGEIDRVKSVLISGLFGESRSAACGIAKGFLVGRFPLSVLKSEIIAAIDYWTEKPIYCCGENFVGGFCPKCRVVPRSPQADLIQSLGKGNLINISELAEYTKSFRSDIVKASVDCIADELQEKPEDLEEIAKGVLEGRFSKATIRAILNSKHLLPDRQHILLELLNSSEEEIRIACLSGLTRATWEFSQQIIDKIFSLTQDQNTQVRNAATRAIRSDVAKHNAKIQLTEGDYMKADYAIITALRMELDAVRCYNTKWEKVNSEDSIQTYYKTTIQNDRKENKIVVAFSCFGMGRVQAANATKDVINDFNPDVVLLVGITAGLLPEKQIVGDIVVPDQIIDYELQKITSDGPEERYQTYRPDALLLNRVKNFDDTSWLSNLAFDPKNLSLSRQPKLYTSCDVLCGDKVDDYGSIASQHLEQWPKAQAFEMESAGVASAIYQTVRQRRMIMIKGISDFVNGHQPDDAKLYAAHTSAAFAFALIKSL